MTLGFKSKMQSELFDKIMRKMNVTKFDCYYSSLALLSSATYKEELLDCVDQGVKLDKVKEVIKPYTNGEKSLIRFGLQCFNENMDNITLPEVLESLDEENREIVKQALRIRYNF
ncbi:TPA: hypothetical protein QCY08_003030 [Bacillus paranthracis]|nr:hypothetical protein [Bacillus paranthracis]